MLVTIRTYRIKQAPGEYSWEFLVGFAARFSQS